MKSIIKNLTADTKDVFGNVVIVDGELLSLEVKRKWLILRNDWPLHLVALCVACCARGVCGHKSCASCKWAVEYIAKYGGSRGPKSTELWFWLGYDVDE